MPSTFTMTCPIPAEHSLLSNAASETGFLPPTLMYIVFVSCPAWVLVSVSISVLVSVSVLVLVVVSVVVSVED